MKCESCGITIPEMPEDATPDELLCDRCHKEYYPDNGARKTQAWIGVPVLFKDATVWNAWKGKITAKLFGGFRLKSNQPDPDEYPCVGVPLCHGQVNAIMEWEFIYKNMFDE